MPQLQFRGTFIRYVDLRYDENSKLPYTKIELTADFSETIRNAMEWGEPQDGSTGADLVGDLSAKTMKLVPNGFTGKDVELTANRIHTFKLHRTDAGEGKKPEYYITFKIATTDKRAGKQLHDYLAVVGKGVGLLRVNYEEQSELEEQAAAAEAEAAEAQEPLISPEQAADTAASGDEETAERGRRKSRLAPVN